MDGGLGSIVGAAAFSPAPVFDTRIRFQGAQPVVEAATGADSTSAVVDLFTLTDGGWVSLGSSTDTAVWSVYGRLSIAFGGSVPYLSWCGLDGQPMFYAAADGGLDKLNAQSAFAAYYANGVECGPGSIYSLWSDGPAGNLWVNQYSLAKEAWTNSWNILSTVGTFPFQSGAAYPTLRCIGGTLYAAYEKGQWAQPRNVEVQSGSPLADGGITWAVEGVSGFEQNVSEPVVIGDARGAPVAIMTDLSQVVGGSLEHSVWRYGDAGWQEVGGPSDLAGYSVNTPGRPELLAATDGSLYALYSNVLSADGFGPSVVTLSRYSGGAWSAVGSFEGAGSINAQSAALAPDGSIWVAYSDQGSGGFLTVARYSPP